MIGFDSPLKRPFIRLAFCIRPNLGFCLTSSYDYRVEKPAVVYFRDYPGCYSKTQILWSPFDLFLLRHHHCCHRHRHCRLYQPLGHRVSPQRAWRRCPSQQEVQGRRRRGRGRRRTLFLVELDCSVEAAFPLKSPLVFLSRPPPIALLLPPGEGTMCPRSTC